MSNLTLVTLPFVLLLLDWWPLRRREASSASPPVSAWRLVGEKVPFLVVAIAAGAAAYLVQKGAGTAARGLLPAIHPGATLVSYCRYLGKLFWPVDLAVLYPHPDFWPTQAVMLSSLCLAAVSVTVLALARKRPYLTVGWFWFLVTLVPVIGLVRPGVPSVADRYTYLPLIGVLIMLVWALQELTTRWRYQPVVGTVIAATLAMPCIIQTQRQLAYWKDTETLFRHTIAVTPANDIPHLGLTTALIHQDQKAEAAAPARKGGMDETIRQLQEAIRLHPNDAKAHADLGLALSIVGRKEEAIAHYREALRLQPDSAVARTNLDRNLRSPAASSSKPR